MYSNYSSRGIWNKYVSYTLYLYDSLIEDSHLQTQIIAQRITQHMETFSPKFVIHKIVFFLFGSNTDAHLICVTVVKYLLTTKMFHSSKLQSCPFYRIKYLRFWSYTTCLFTMNNTTGKKDQELETLLEIMFFFLLVYVFQFDKLLFSVPSMVVCYFFCHGIKIWFSNTLLNLLIFLKIYIQLRYYFIIKFKPQSYILWISLFSRVSTFVDSWKCVNIWFRYYAKVLIQTKRICVPCRTFKIVKWYPTNKNESIVFCIFIK